MSWWCHSWVLGILRFFILFYFCVCLKYPIIKVFYKKNKHSIICCNYLWKEGTVAFVCFQRIITTGFFKKNMPIEISPLLEIRKIKLLDIEQIILDLNVSTYISLIHPLNSLSPNSNTVWDYQRKHYTFQRWRYKRKTLPPTHLRSGHNDPIHLPLVLFSELLSVEEFLPHTYKKSGTVFR